MERVGRSRELRTRFMEGLYEEANGTENVPRGVSLVAEKMGLRFRDPEDREQITSIISYLSGHGLVRLRAGGTIADLTHAGVMEVEAALSQPEQPTEYLGPMNNIYVHTMTNSQIQQSSPGASQKLNVLGQEEVQRLQPVVQSLRNQIDDFGLEEADRSELEAEIRTLESQMASPKPKKEIVESGLRSAQRILEGAAAGAAASGLLQGIQAALSSF